MNKKEKTYFIGKIISNHINYDGKEEFDRNWEILEMFKALDMISHDLFSICVQLIKDGAKEDRITPITICQEYLCEEFGIPIRI